MLTIIENNVYDNPISFEELCEISDSGLTDSSVQDEYVSKYKKEEEKSDVIITVIHNDVSKDTLHRSQEVTYKVKKMSTKQLKSIFSKHRSYECDDRETLILVVCNILIDEIVPEYNEQVSKRTYHIELMNKSEIKKLSWEQIKEIRRLYNIKNGKDSCYSFKEIGDLYNLSHIFTRNICLGKVYKESKV